ncbi:DegT/DnrJ/EryC1/StrS family aminotransferase [Verrucomicrobiaceae bacterium N1E253]|uniref:DegT/DnrJ/EryC1/StrS family aminotransferase n=1 Tax=Oceaniferula marina TaxID=2748318 RepID=A0A851GCJ5_9BACT|nr:DegT/DnrJ/EryC1/StrS family aminotransferase [Oceaniferula marina]NWK55146.1 DegT/DnrJ/EryC1/StrS family aminotransferase [Oceaniferula marina]
MPVPLLDVNAQNHALKTELRAAFDKVLESGRFIMGEEVEAFESEVGSYVGAKHAIGVSSGTDAILLALMALGIGPGDEVICPSFTFFATAGCIARTGATPVFCDCHPDTFNLDFTSAEACISEQTKAIIPVHLFGQSIDMKTCDAFARKHGLKVIEDTAQSLGASYHGKYCGAMSDFGTYSFFPSKNLGGLGDGGLLVTQDDQLAEIAVKMRNHGMHPRYYHEMVGGNFRLDALQAALLRVKFQQYPEYTRLRQHNAAYYHEGLADVNGLVLPVTDEGNEHIWNQFTIRVLDGKRDALRQGLLDLGIGCEIYYPVPMHQQQCFAHLADQARSAFKVTEQLAAEVLSIPVYPELTQSQKDEVIEAIRSLMS